MHVEKNERGLANCSILLFSFIIICHLVCRMKICFHQCAPRRIGHARRMFACTRFSSATNPDFGLNVLGAIMLGNFYFRREYSKDFRSRKRRLHFIRHFPYIFHSLQVQMCAVRGQTPFVLLFLHTLALQLIHLDVQVLPIQRIIPRCADSAENLSFCFHMFIVWKTGQSSNHFSLCVSEIWQWSQFHHS